MAQFIKIKGFHGIDSIEDSILNNIQINRKMKPVNDFESPVPPPPSEALCLGTGPQPVSAALPASTSLASLLKDWAARNGVDEDLALLICACTAAHAAGPRLRFEDGTECDHLPAPTLIAEAGHTGFHQAVGAAIEPLLAIQRDRIALHD